MQPLTIRFFGSFQITPEDPPHAVSLKTEKARALFAYLLFEHDQPHRRAKLIDLFWSGFADKAAHNSLRQALYNIRGLTDSGPAALKLLTTTSDVQLIPQGGVWVDAFELTSLLKQCEKHHPSASQLCETCLQTLVQAVELYRGDFMDGFSLPDASQFDWWLLHKREASQRQALKSLTWITNSLLAKNDYLQAVGFAQREVELFPWCEPAHQRYMKALALGGERGKALQQFEVCRSILAAEVGIAPSAETRSLFEQIRMDALPV